MKRVVEVLARGVLVVRGRLLVCRPRRGGYSYLPGGHVEPGESSKQALEREVLEELGVHSSCGAFLGCVEYGYERKGKRISEVNLLHLLSAPDLKPARAPVSREDYIEFAWLKVAELDRSDLQPHILRGKLKGWLSSPGAAEQWLYGKSDPAESSG